MDEKLADRWMVTWMTNNHPTLGNCRNRQGRREFASKEAAEGWVKYLQEHETATCYGAAMFPATAAGR